VGVTAQIEEAPRPGEARSGSRIGAAYDGSNVIFRALRACGWGPLLNLGYHPFGRPFTLLNYALVPGTLTPYHRLSAAQMRLVKQSVRLLGLSATDRARVLDIGCGRGASSFVIANLSPAAAVVGLDLLAENLGVAGTLYHGTPNLSFVRADAHDVPFRAGSFDRVLCLEAAFHFSDRNRFLQQVAQALAPGGRAVVVDFMWRNERDRQIWDDEPTRMVRQTWQWENFDSIARYESHAEANGFRVEAKHDWTGHVTAPLITLLSWAMVCSRSAWGQRLLTRYVPLLEPFTAEDWRELDRQGAAHCYVARRARYVALVLRRHKGS
jgi:cyclopropane fatty-acyl-phospholipid synthase-like methyltransferase